MSEEIGANGLWFLDARVSIKLSRADNADGISVLEFHMPLDHAPPLHVHHEEDEIFHVLDGEARFLVGGKTLVGRAGDTLLAPRGIPHGFRVTSPEGARFLIVTRGGFEAMVRAASRPAAAPGLPEQVAPTPEMQAELAAHCAAQGIDLLGPPIA